MEDDLKKIRKLKRPKKNKNIFSIPLKFKKRNGRRPKKKLKNGRRPKKNKKMEDDLKK